MNLSVASLTFTDIIAGLRSYLPRNFFGHSIKLSFDFTTPFLKEILKTKSKFLYLAYFVKLLNST